jgi:hypothetical protein
MTHNDRHPIHERPDIRSAAPAVDDAAASVLETAISANTGVDADADTLEMLVPADMATLDLRPMTRLAWLDLTLVGDTLEVLLADKTRPQLVLNTSTPQVQVRVHGTLHNLHWNSPAFPPAGCTIPTPRRHVLVDALITTAGNVKKGADVTWRTLIVGGGEWAASPRLNAPHWSALHLLHVQLPGHLTLRDRWQHVSIDHCTGGRIVQVPLVRHLVLNASADVVVMNIKADTALLTDLPQTAIQLDGHQKTLRLRRCNRLHTLALGSVDVLDLMGAPALQMVEGRVGECRVDTDSLAAPANPAGTPLAVRPRQERDIAAVCARGYCAQLQAMLQWARSPDTMDVNTLDLAWDVVNASSRVPGVPPSELLNTLICLRDDGRLFVPNPIGTSNVTGKILTTNETNIDTYWNVLQRIFAQAPELFTTTESPGPLYATNRWLAELQTLAEWTADGVDAVTARGRFARTCLDAALHAMELAASRGKRLLTRNLSAEHPSRLPHTMLNEHAAMQRFYADLVRAAHLQPGFRTTVDRWIDLLPQLAPPRVRLPIIGLLWRHDYEQAPAMWSRTARELLNAPATLGADAPDHLDTMRLILAQRVPVLGA